MMTNDSPYRPPEVPNPATSESPPVGAAPPTIAGPIVRRQPLDDTTVGSRMLLPVGRSPFAIVAGYLGLLSVLLFPAPFALVFGIVAVVHIRRTPATYGMGRAIFAIVIGALGTIGLALAIAGGLLA